MTRSPVYMPKFGMTMTEALIVECFREEGAIVKQGDPLLSIETEKANTDIVSPADGILVEVRYNVGETVSTGEILAFIVDRQKEMAGGGTSPIPDNEIKVETSRKTTDESSIVGGQPKGPGQPQALKGLRKQIADNMRHSLSYTAQLSLMRDVVVNNLAAYKSGHEGISYNDLLIKAAALALEKHPNVQTQLIDGYLHQPGVINIGMAVALENGLVVPVIKNANKLSLKEIAAERKRLVNKARESSLDLKEISGNVCTISNLGRNGIDAFTPILNPPETVILGIGRILPRPWVEDGKLVVKNVMHLSVTFDHQVIDGVVAAEFLQTFCDLLETPEKLKENTK